MELWSRLSDWTFTTAAAVYALAIVLCLAEQVFPRWARLGRMGVALVVLGALLHLVSLVGRGVAAGRMPWGNMYEYVSAACWMGVVAWLFLLRRWGMRRMTPFVLLPVVILLFLAGTVLYAEVAPLQPALQSYWLVIHVSAAALSSGVLLVSGVVSLLFLTHDTRVFRGRLPSREALDRVAYRVAVFALPIFTFAIICGGIWAEAAWGRFWGWDPKETMSFVAWVVYAAYLHARSTSGWKGRPAAVINSVGFGVIVFNLFFINLVTAGLHSYAGV